MRATQPFAIGVHEAGVGDFQLHDDEWPGAGDLPVRSVSRQDVERLLAASAR